MRILFLSRWYPFPADNGSKLRIAGLLRALCAEHEVTLISFVDPEEAREPEPPSPPGPVAIQVCPFREFRAGSARALAGFLSPTPRFLIDTFSPSMDAAIRRAVANHRFDLVIASQVSMAAYHRSFCSIPAMFEEVELGIYHGSTGGQTALGGMRRAVTWQKHRRFIARLLRHFAACTVVSEVEHHLVAHTAPDYDRLHVIPNFVESDPPDVFDAGRKRSGLIFTGSLRYGPNRDAMEWFVRQVWPHVRAKVPSAEIAITGDPGSNAPVTADGVTVAGRVPDVRAALRRSAAAVAPIRSGGGTRLKVLEAMATRTPLVVTPKAVEGLAVRNGEHVLIAENASDFARAVSRVLCQPMMAREMADRACRLFNRTYASDAVLPRFARLVEGIAGSSLAGSALTRRGSAA